MRLRLFVCPMCGRAHLVNFGYQNPTCFGTEAERHVSATSFVHDVELPAPESAKQEERP